jgi:hypothetical protein
MDLAMKRLAAALDLLEGAAEARLRSADQRTDLAQELSLMQDDRSRLAIELDHAIAHSRELETANGEVQRRLDRIGTTLRGILAKTDGEI